MPRPPANPQPSRNLVAIANSVVERTVGALPSSLRKAMRGVPVLLERMPTRPDIQSGIEPDTLGFFDEEIEGMPRIRLWLDNIFDFAEADIGVFEEEVEKTLLHEIGHLIGFDEDDLEERGMD